MKAAGSARGPRNSRAWASSSAATRPAWASGSVTRPARSSPSHTSIVVRLQFSSTSGAAAAEDHIGRDGHDQAEARPGGAGEDDRREHAEQPPRGRHAELFGVGAHQSTVVGWIEAMTGRWGWRGTRGREADDAAPDATGGPNAEATTAEVKPRGNRSRVRRGDAARRRATAARAASAGRDQRDPGAAPGRGRHPAAVGAAGAEPAAAGRGLVVAAARDRPPDLRAVPGGQRTPPGGPAVHRGPAADGAASAADRAAAPDRDALARGDLVHGPGRHRGPGRAHDPRRRPGERRLPGAAGPGAAHRPSGPGVAGRAAVPDQQPPP